MINILGISGSPRKAATEYVLEQAMDAAAAVTGVKIDIINLRGKKINFCISCNKCLKDESETCVIYEDDMSPLYEPVYKADGYVIASPVYLMNVTAQLKAFFDRFRPTYTILKDDPDYFSRKVGGAIAVGGRRNGGQEATINSIFGFYHTMGMIVMNGGLGAYSGGSVWSRDQLAKGASEDEIGMENARRVGRRVAELAVTLGKSPVDNG